MAVPAGGAGERRQTLAERVAAERLLELADAAVAIAQAPTLADALRVLTERARLLLGAQHAATRLDGAEAPHAAAGKPPAGGGESVQVPLVARDGAQLGSLELTRGAGAAFDKQDRAALTQLAHLGGALIENVRLVEQMQRARTEAESANRAKSDFLATMSHEIRTPINAVLGYTELLEIGVSGPLTPAQRQHLSRLRSSSVHLLRLVDEVLDLARIEAGRLDVASGTHRFTEAADLALALVRPLAEQGGVLVEDRCSARTDLQYRGDADRVRQILLNLLNNAVKFTEPGGCVTLDCEEVTEPPRSTRLPPGHWLRASVADTGIGITPDLQVRLFDPFVSGEQGHTRRYGGSGLGLSISRRLARVMGGDITVSSEAGAGSTFTLWLPGARAPVDAPPRIASDLATDYAHIPEPILQRAGRVLLRNSVQLQQRFTAALRREPLFEPIRALPDAVVADHGATLFADIASCVQAAHTGLGTAVPLLRDGTRIQRLVSERHGEQRAQLGLSPAAIRREHAIMRQLLADVLHRGLDQKVDAAVLEEVIALVAAMLDQAEYTALLAARRVAVR